MKFVPEEKTLETEPKYIHYWKRIIPNKELYNLLKNWKKDKYWLILLDEKLRREEAEIYIKSVS